jgi:hypothetical protein
MAKIVVSPERFSLVFFDAGRIAELAGHVADQIGLPDDLEVRIEVDERMPLGRTKIPSLDPVTLSVEGGAFEDAKRPRHMSERSVQDVLGRMLLRVKDRLDPGFDHAPSDEDLTLQQLVAWTVYSEGRCERLGLPTQKQRWLYHFRNRHGFSDVADAAFNRLWDAEELTWAEIDAICDETQQARDELAGPESH